VGSRNSARKNVSLRKGAWIISGGG